MCVLKKQRVKGREREREKKINSGFFKYAFMNCNFSACIFHNVVAHSKKNKRPKQP